MLLRNYYRCIAALIKGTDTGAARETVVDVSGNSFTYYVDGYVGVGPMEWNGVAGDLVHGLICGSDNTPVDPADYYVKGLIDHGDTDGSLSYDETQCVEEWSAEGVYTLTISRFVTNNGSIDVTIKEVCGCVLVPYDQSSGHNKGTCVMREVLATPIVVSAGGSKRIVSTFTITPPYVS